MYEARKLPIAIAVALALTGGSAATHAQTVSAGLEEVVVTARKREESVQDVPVHVTAYSAEQIRRKDLTSLEKLAATTPNFNVGRTSNGSGARITMRGIGSTPSSIGIEQSVAVIVDNVYYGQGRVINEGFFDLQGVEILKGPQALFFGKNATAGAVSLTTASPGEETELKLRASYEFEAETTQVEAVYSSPLSDTVGLRIAVRASAMDGGYYNNEMYDFVYPRLDIATGALNIYEPDSFSDEQPQEDQLLARVTLQWTPSDTTTANLK
ncbi:MAG: TonB-dependent receptor plug domain-containing protein, partial [Gammaproteobacteria bacterium]